MNITCDTFVLKEYITLMYILNIVQDVIIPKCDSFGARQNPGLLSTERGRLKVPAQPEQQSETLSQN